MESWPFTAEETSRVREAVRAVVNAALADDAVLVASQFEELRDVLHALRYKYGEHPFLLETEAEFANNPSERATLYEQAEQVALAGGWATYTIRISLARVLLEDLGYFGRAMRVLVACHDEVTACADESERREWQELLQECNRRTSSLGDRDGWD